MIYVYALKSLKDGRIYVGQTANIGKRLIQHNNGSVKSTKYFMPWKLFHSKSCNNRVEARQLEKYLKSGCGKEQLKKICAHSPIG